MHGITSQDFDSTKANFGDPGQSPHLIDVNFGTPQFSCSGLAAHE